MATCIDTDEESESTLSILSPPWYLLNVFRKQQLGLILTNSALPLVALEMRRRLEARPTLPSLERVLHRLLRRSREMRLEWFLARSAPA